MKVYFPQDQHIQVHKTRVTSCPGDMPAGYYWYGRKKHSPGRPPGWLTALADSPTAEEARDKVTAEDNDGNGVTEDTTAQAELDSQPGNLSPNDNAAETPATDTEPSPLAESESSRPQGRYTLRSRVHPPARLMHVSSGRASIQAGVM